MTSAIEQRRLAVEQAFVPDQVEARSNRCPQFQGHIGVAASEHHQLAAIMFTDMVGYSALSRRNEA